MLKTRKNQARYIPDNNGNVTDNNTERAILPLYKVVSQTSQQKSKKKFKNVVDRKSPMVYTVEVSKRDRVRGVAQFGRALRSGRRGRKFESCHLDMAL